MAKSALGGCWLCELWGYGCAYSHRAQGATVLPQMGLEYFRQGNCSCISVHALQQQMGEFVSCLSIVQKTEDIRTGNESHSEPRGNRATVNVVGTDDFLSLPAFLMICSWLVKGQIWPVLKGIIEPFVWKNLWRSSSASPCNELGHLQPDQAVQSPAQPHFSSFQGWGVHQLSGQLVPVSPPWKLNFLPNMQCKFALF